MAVKQATKSREQLTDVFLRTLIHDFRSTPREVIGKGTPEGLRFIKISDELAV
jgi:hypothetical protein